MADFHVFPKCTGLSDSDYTQVFSALRLPPYVVEWNNMLPLCKAIHFGSFQFPFRVQTTQTFPPALNSPRFLGCRSFTHTQTRYLLPLCSSNATPETATDFLQPKLKNRMELSLSFSALPQTSALPQETCSTLQFSDC